MIRFVYGNDVIPGVPPAWTGYRHVGTYVQIGRSRRLLALSGTDHWPGIRDGIRAMLAEAGLDRSEIGY